MPLTKATALAVQKAAVGLADAERDLRHAGLDIQEITATVQAGEEVDIDALRDDDELKAKASAYLDAVKRHDETVAKAVEEQ